MELRQEDYDGETIDSRWVDDDSKDPMRSRIVCKDYNTGPEEGVFAGTPDAVCLRIWLHILASDPELALMIIDMESAFLQPRLKKDKGERLVVRPPPDLRKAGILWDMNVPLYGWRYASVSWQDHQAEIYCALGFRRCPLEGCMFMNDGVEEEKAIVMEELELNKVCLRKLIHGDDAMVIGRREKLKQYFNTDLSAKFVCTMKSLISRHHEDDKEGKFLRRCIRLTETGWEYEADVKHVRALIARYDLDRDDAKPAMTPGIKESAEEVNYQDEAERDEYDPILTSANEVREHRGGVGTGGFLAGDRIDIKFPVKEVQRDGALPRRSSVRKMKRIARYLKRVPRFVNVYRWQKVKRGVRRKLQGAVDADHAGCLRTRRSTQCIIMRVGKHVLLDQSQTQPGLPALSSGESKYRGLTRCAVEALYVRNLLRFLRLESEIELETDSSAAKGCSGRLGAGKRMRHLEVQNFFLQGLIKERQVTVKKVKGTEQIADLGMKHLSWPTMVTLLQMMDVKLLTLGGVSILPTCEAAATTEVRIVGDALIALNDQLDVALEQLKVKLVWLVLLLLTLRIAWVFGEKVLVEMIAENLKAFLRRVCGYGGRDSNEVEPVRQTIEIAEPITQPIGVTPQLTQVYGCRERGDLKVHLYPDCVQLRKRQRSTRGIDRDVCYYCAEKKKKEFEERFIAEGLDALIEMQQEG